ncbi:hypothetical protein J1N35_016447 [Gossypium stocksii]|uniref:Uncharacterized protein n=1 Tax=Gossypium stocksii TaxID=47602 RepID=A0A9D3VLP0_9ROSI|nr:hypothetical protein J1N35_016447 [Gossypium stocksii]
MRVAGKMFIHSSRRGIDLSFSGLTLKETQDVELALLLLAAKVGYREFECTSMLVKQCEFMSSRTGNLVQQIEIDTGKGSRSKSVLNFDELMMRPNPAILACHGELPFSQIIPFVGIQAIVEHVSKAKKVHIIDLGIKTRVQWTVVVVSDMLDLKENLFEVDVGETVAVYAATTLRSMLVMPNRMYFDCHVTCMKRNCVNREIVESVYFAEGIRNMVAAEGEERKGVFRSVWNGGGGIKYVIFVPSMSCSKNFCVRKILHTRYEWKMLARQMEGNSGAFDFVKSVIKIHQPQVLSKLQDQASTRFHPCMESFDDYLSELNEFFNGRCYNLSGDKIKDVSS